MPESRASAARHVAEEAERLARVHVKGTFSVGVDHRQRGDVTMPDVLGEPEINQPVDQIGIEHRAPLDVYKR